LGEHCLITWHRGFDSSLVNMMLEKIETITTYGVIPPCDAHDLETILPSCELIIDGEETRHRIKGCWLEAAFQCDIGYLVFLTNDCPFEERLCIHLLDLSGKPLDSASIFWIYYTGNFRDWQIYQPDKLSFRFSGDVRWTIQILPKFGFRIPIFSEPAGAWRQWGFKRHFKITRVDDIEPYRSRFDVSASEVFQDPTVVKLADAAAKGDKQTIAELACQGADVNTVGMLGEQKVSLLLWAFDKRNIDGMLALLKAGADPTVTDEEGKTVLHHAAEIEEPEPLQALLDAGVNPDLRNPKNGETPLFRAIWENREPQFRALLAADADVNACEWEAEVGEDNVSCFKGNTLLHCAATFGREKFILALLHAGANPRAVNALGKTFQYQWIWWKESHYRQSPWWVRSFHLFTDETTQNIRKIEFWLKAHNVKIEHKRDGDNAAGKSKRPCS